MDLRHSRGHSNTPSRLLLDWYDENRRSLPWRAPRGITPDPYHVWLSEIMLQQTGVTTVIPYFNRFIEAWQSIGELAKAHIDDVLHAWQGLGYYARARNLHKCANLLIKFDGGKLPFTESELLALPGIGHYTAAAIVAIAYNTPSTPVDGNIQRVISRVYSIKTPTPHIKPVIRKALGEILPIGSPGDFVQGLMDLGALVCKPKKPLCSVCPWKRICSSTLRGDWANYPITPAKKSKPLRHGIVFWLVRDDGAVLLNRRPNFGLLGGMIEFPSTEWRGQEWTKEEAERFAPIQAQWNQVNGLVSHSFTHFDLRLRIVSANTDHNLLPASIWAKPSEFRRYAFPTVMKKVYQIVSSPQES